MIRRVALVTLAVVAVAASASAIEIGEATAPVHVSALTGETFSFPDPHYRATVVAFLSTVCPYSKRHAAHLQQLHAAYAAQGVLFVGVNSNRTETADEVRAQTAGLFFPVIKDDHNTLADALGALVTPEVFLFDAGGRLQYRGRILSKLDAPDLMDALKAVLAGRAVRAPERKAYGCYIQRE